MESGILGFGFRNASSTDNAFENPVPGVGNPQREIHLAVQYLLRIMCLYSVMRLVGVGLVRNSNKVKWKRLMFQKQYPFDLVIKYIWAIILLRKKQSIEETLTVGFNHAVADTGERAPLIFTPNGGPKGRKKIFRRPPPSHNDSLVEAVMLNCL